MKFYEKHQILVEATPAQAYEALWKVDFSQSWLIRQLFRLRGLKPETFAQITKRFTVLQENPGHEIVLRSYWAPLDSLRKHLSFYEREL